MVKREERYQSSHGQLDRLARSLGFADEREFILDYKARGESRRSVSQRTGCPYSTLVNAEKRYYVRESSVRLKEEVAG
jgi:hypothetical protein